MGFSFEAGPFDRKRHSAMRRFCELLRHARNGTDPTPRAADTPSRHGQHDAAVGRYIHLAIDGLDYRLYYEEAGYMLTGEYDGFTIPVSQEAAAAIDGAELQIMEGLGHFPMSEDPEGFATYVLPILDRIAAAGS